MLKRICLIGAVLAMTSPALAETTCGTIPPAPELPNAAALSGKTVEEVGAIKSDAIGQVHSYQDRLKSFRACLEAQRGVQNTAIANAKDDAAKKEPMAEIQRINAANDKTVDDETKMVADWNAFAAAYCKVADCSKKK